MPSGPELPVIYENPRFDAATPTLKPVIDRAIRFGGILMLEWGTLTLIEDSPRYLKFTTVGIAVLILAVHESWPWLRMRNKRLYPVFMGTLVATYASIFAYAFLTEPSKHSTAITTINTPSSPREAQIADVGIDWNGGVGPIVFRGRFTKTGEIPAVFIEYGTAISQAPVVGTFINWERRRIPINFKNRAIRNAEVKIVVGVVTEEVEGHQLVLQIGSDPGLKMGIGNQSYLFRLVFVFQSGDEESYPFALVATRTELGTKTFPATIIDPAVFSGRGNL